MGGYFRLFPLMVRFPPLLGKSVLCNFTVNGVRVGVYCAFAWLGCVGKISAPATEHRSRGGKKV